MTTEKRYRITLEVPPRWEEKEVYLWSEHDDLYRVMEQAAKELRKEGRVVAVAQVKLQPFLKHGGR